MSSGLIDNHDAPAAHPLVAFTDALEGLLDDAAAGHAWTMTPSELQAVLPRLTRARNRLAEVELRVLREADRASVGDDVGATNTPAWWAHLTGQPVPATQGLAKLAEQLDTTHQTTRDALATGRVNPDQARVIVHAVTELPRDLDPTLVADAEAHLVGLADLDGQARLDPRALRVAGRKILDMIAPEIGEAHEAALLEAEEHHAAATATFTMRPDGHGSMVGRFKIPLLAGEILAKHLNAIAAPRHQHSAPVVEVRAQRASKPPIHDQVGRVARPLRWGQAFTEYLETRDTACDGSPKAGGIAATVVVTMPLETLLGAEHAATLDTGQTISPAQARRLCCEAGIIPAVLGGPSQVLDLGRKTRFHTEPQRIAIMLRDHGCATLGCDWPPGMCHTHHHTPWSTGGNTSVDDAIMLCPRHHTLAHDSRYQLTTISTGTTTGRKVTFTRRT